MPAGLLLMEEMDQIAFPISLGILRQRDAGSADAALLAAKYSSRTRARRWRGRDDVLMFLATVHSSLVLSVRRQVCRAPQQHR